MTQQGLKCLSLHGDIDQKIPYQEFINQHLSIVMLTLIRGACIWLGKSLAYVSQHKGVSTGMAWIHVVQNGVGIARVPWDNSFWVTGCHLVKTDVLN